MQRLAPQGAGWNIPPAHITLQESKFHKSLSMGKIVHRKIFQLSPRARRGCTGMHTSALGCCSHSTCGCGAPRAPVSLGAQCDCWGCSACARLLAFLLCHCGYGWCASVSGRLKASPIAGIQCCCEQAQQPPNYGPCKHRFLTHFSFLSSSFPPVH